MPKTWKISQISLQTVRAGSTSLSDKTLIKAVPSVSKSHSALALNSPASVITILFFSAVWGKCMYTFEMASKPCRVKSDNIFASIQRKNMSSSILSASSSSPPPASSLSSVFIILIRKTSFSALSSLKMQLRSSPKPALIFSEICSMVNFLSVILFRSSSIRRSQGEILDWSKSGIS